MGKKRILCNSTEWSLIHTEVNHLPEEILEQVLGYAIEDGFDWRSLELVCKRWQDLCLSIRSRRYSSLVASTDQANLCRIATHINLLDFIEELHLIQPNEVDEKEVVTPVVFLKSLKIEGCGLSPKTIISIFPNIERLDLSKQKKALSMEGLSNLVELKFLRELRVNIQLPGSSDQWLDEDLVILLRRLNKLSLTSHQDGQLLPSIPAVIGTHLLNIESLELNDMLETFELVAQEMNSENLKDLSISEGVFTITARSAFEHLIDNSKKSLQRLNIRSKAPLSCAIHANRMIEHSMDSLEALKMEGFYYTPTMMQSIADKCPHVRRISLTNGFVNMVLVPKVVERWFGWMNQLENLSLAGICANCIVDNEYSRNATSSDVNQTKDVRRYNMLQSLQAVQRHP